MKVWIVHQNDMILEIFDNQKSASNFRDELRNLYRTIDTKVSFWMSEHKVTITEKKD